MSARRPIVSSDGRVSPDLLRLKIIAALGGYSPLLRGWRRVQPRWFWVRTSPLGRVTRRYVAEHGFTVRRGVFEGMVYPATAVGHAGFLPAKLLGTYEQELNTELEADTSDVFVDIGSGDGYFCVGMARRRPGAHVIGFELQVKERQSAQNLAAQNGVSVEWRGGADFAELEALPPGELTILCDIEGAEEELLDPAEVPRLRQATMIIEAHVLVRDGIVETLTKRFSDTHVATVIHGQPRDPAALPELARWDQESAAIAVSEGRATFGVWLVLTPRRSDG